MMQTLTPNLAMLLEACQQFDQCQCKMKENIFNIWHICPETKIKTIG